MSEKIIFDSIDSYLKTFHPHMAIYAFNGVGKTTFSGKTGLRTLLLDCGDAGAVTLRSSSLQTGWNPKNLKIVRVRSILHYLDIMDQVMRMTQQIELLVIDTLSGLQSLAIKEVKGKRNFEMNQRKWGAAGSRVIECISETRNFPNSLIYLAQEKRKKTGEDEPETIGPSLSPGIREYLSGSVDWIGRMYVEDDKRKLSFVLTDSIEAKDRGGLFPKVIANPSYLPIRKRIMETIQA